MRYFSKISCFYDFADRDDVIFENTAFFFVFGENSASCVRQSDQTGYFSQIAHPVSARIGLETWGRAA